MLDSPMLPAITSLLALQDLETRAEDARKRLADAPVRTSALDAVLAEATQSLDRARALLADSQAARRDLEKEAAVALQRVSKYKEQLMQAKDNKQFHALQHEITTFSDEVQRVEGLVLERMLEGDELTAVVKAAEARLAAEKTRVAAEKQAIEADAAAVSDTLARIHTERAQLVKTIEPRLLATFETVAKGRKGVGIARAVDGLCEACRVRIRPHLYNQLRAGDQVIQCESCVRILYYVPPPKSDDADAQAPPGITSDAEPPSAS
jgi:predicted  nucleic acid-binding Zn-ribbon protein